MMNCFTTQGEKGIARLAGLPECSEADDRRPSADGDVGCFVPSSGLTPVQELARLLGLAEFE